jgi:hypothetical protein
MSLKRRPGYEGCRLTASGAGRERARSRGSAVATIDEHARDMRAALYQRCIHIRKKSRAASFRRREQRERSPETITTGRSVVMDGRPADRRWLWIPGSLASRQNRLASAPERRGATYDAVRLPCPTVAHQLGDCASRDHEQFYGLAFVPSFMIESSPPAMISATASDPASL